MYIYIVVIATSVVTFMWFNATKQKLIMLNDNIGNAMNQMGIYLSKHIDLLSLLLDFTEEHAQFESQTVQYLMQSRRYLITAKSSTEDVMLQEGLIAEVMGKIAIITRQYPHLTESQTYAHTMETVRIFESLLRTGRIIYNESAIQLNREVQSFPVSVVAKLSGVTQREFLE